MIYLHILDQINAHVGVQDSAFILIVDFKSIVRLRRGYVYALLVCWILLAMIV